jgi:choline-sulfatase
MHFLSQSPRTPANLLIIMSDQHNRRTLGCYGRPIVATPNLDRLARRGALFESAYTPCPVCVPARAAFATGKYVHQIGTWDNAIAYDGRVPSWHHLLRDRGHHVVSIGKLHPSRRCVPSGHRRAAPLGAGARARPRQTR